MKSLLELRKQEVVRKRIAIKRKNQESTDELRLVPCAQWPTSRNSRDNHIAVWLSNRFLVQVIKEDQMIRLSVNRTAISATGGWVDGITWDELQDIKNTVGYATYCAVEIYPPASEVVNVANIRHLWIYTSGGPDFVWKR